MGIRIGRVFGIPIDIDYSWLPIFALFAYSVAEGHFGCLYPDLPAISKYGLGIVTAALFFASLVAHELSHSYFARRAGIPIAGITLFIFGGVARMKSEPDRPVDELKMALAGPAFSFSVAIVAYLLSIAFPVEPISAILLYIAGANAIVAFFNMIPGFPLDGGRVLRALIWMVTRDLRMATQAASITGQIFGWALIAFGLVGLLFGGSFGGIWLMFIGWFLNNAAQASYRQLLIRKALEDIEVAEVMSPVSELIDPGISIDDLVHEYFLRTHADSYAVAGDGGVAGVVRLEDVRSVPRDQWAIKRVGEITHPLSEECVIEAHEKAWAAASKLTEDCPTKVVVQTNGHAVGTIGQENLARILRTRSLLDLDQAA